MHIGFVSVESPFETDKGGGIGAYLRGVLPALSAAGHRATVLANSLAREVTWHCDGAVKVVPVRLPNVHWYLNKLPLMPRLMVHPVRQMEWSREFHRAAANAFRGDPADVLECCETGALALAREPVAPLIIRAHGSTYTFQKYSAGKPTPGARWDRRLEVQALRRAHAISTPSHFQALEVAHDTQCSLDRIHVIPNPVSGALLDARPGPVVSGDGAMVLYTGRLAPVKGILPLLAAAQEVRRSEPAARFVLAGPWQMPQAPEALGLRVNAESDAGGVWWMGHLQWDRLQELYREAAVFVAPSYFESFGISVVEAMAWGLPVVAAAAGSLPEIVEDGVTGFLAPPDDPRAMSEAIVRLLRDKDLRTRMGQAGRARVLERFTPARVARESLDLYESVANAREAGVCVAQKCKAPPRRSKYRLRQ